MQTLFAQKTGKAFNQAAVLILAASGMLAFAFFKIYEKIRIYAPIIIHKIKTACSCSQMASLSSHPYIFTALVILGMLAVFFLIYSAYKLISLIVRTRKYSLAYLKLSRFTPSSKLSRIIERLGIKKNRIAEIRSKAPVVFCFGILKAKICVSSGLVKMLKDAELKAVLLHEYQHLKSRDPLKLFFLKYFQSILFFVPGVKMFIKKYITFSELAADEKATNNFTDRSTLVRAILKVTQKEEGSVLRAGLAMSFFSSVITERVNRLSDDNYAPKFKLFGKGFLFGASSIIVVSLLLFVFLSDSSKAFGDYGTGCAYLEQSHSNENTCQADNYSQTCQMTYSAYQNNTSCAL